MRLPSWRCRQGSKKKKNNNNQRPSRLLVSFVPLMCFIMNILMISPLWWCRRYSSWSCSCRCSFSCIARRGFADIVADDGPPSSIFLQFERPRKLSLFLYSVALHYNLLTDSPFTFSNLGVKAKVRASCAGEVCRARQRVVKPWRARTRRVIKMCTNPILSSIFSHL